MKRRPVHPGTIFKQAVLEPLSVTITDAARRLGITRKALSELVNGRSSLSPEMAVRIGRATGTSPEMWINMQSKLDIWIAEQKKIKVKSLKKVG